MEPAKQMTMHEIDTMDKKAKATWRTDHDLHVLLIMKQKSCSKGDATVQAYAEGRNGLSKRLE